MKKAFLLLCALLLALGSALPLAGYRLARAVLSRRADVPPAPASSTSAASEAAPAAFECCYCKGTCKESETSFV